MRIIILVIVFLFIGFFIYKLKNYRFTSNCRVILNILLSELNEINHRLNIGDLKEKDFDKLIERKKEINDILVNFFGKNIAL